MHRRAFIVAGVAGTFALLAVRGLAAEKGGMSDRLEKARDFILRNARLLERRRFEVLFEGGSNASVVQALAPYQNRDGGFGAALEPDKRVPDSQPQDVEIAFHILDEVDALSGDLVRRACDWLDSVTTADGGVPYALPSVNDYPHTFWWAVKETEPPANLNPTAAILGLLLKHGVDHPWVARAAGFCWRAIEATETTEFHDLIPMITFLEHAPDDARAGRELDRIAARIGRPGVVEMDPDAQGYLMKPLDWAPTPASFCRKLFSDAVIAAHLEALAKRQEADGGWPISWDAVGPGALQEWRGMRTIAALQTLRAYGV